MQIGKVSLNLPVRNPNARDIRYDCQRETKLYNHSEDSIHTMECKIIVVKVLITKNKSQIILINLK